MKKALHFILRYVYALASCLYLFTIGIFSAKHRSFLFRICDYFGYFKKSLKADIPKIEIHELVPEDIQIQLRQPLETVGNISPVELSVIAKLIKLYNPKRIFEIGTFEGRLALNMSANALEDTKVYTLDLPKEKLNSTKLPTASGDRGFINKEAIGSRFLGTDCQKKIVQLYGDSATFDFSPYFNSVDLVVVDGSHSYEYVLNDSRVALKLLKNGKGVILWHDYESPSWPGVTKALDELYSENNEFRDLKYINGISLVCLVIK